MSNQNQPNPDVDGSLRDLGAIRKELVILYNEEPDFARRVELLRLIDAIASLQRLTVKLKELQVSKAQLKNLEGAPDAGA